MDDHKHIDEMALRVSRLVKVVATGVIGVLCGIGAYDLGIYDGSKSQNSVAMVEEVKIEPIEVKGNVWEATPLTKKEKEEALLSYGKELVANTAVYLGPKGKVAQISNGMNCQNCHLDAGTRPFGNNYSAVFANYPKYRARSGSIEDIQKRITDCFERSLNGQAPPEKEMNAMIAYINWVGSAVEKGSSPVGSGIYKLPFLDRAADPIKGKEIYAAKCQSCHQENGQGLMDEKKIAYTYPPLWGDHSYNVGAGLYRLSMFAGYIKANMPLGATYKNPMLTNAEAWDVASYVETMPRPTKDLSKDWPKIAEKPIDHPFGPYADGFDEQQHKLGPFAAIKAAKEKLSKK